MLTINLLGLCIAFIVPAISAIVVFMNKKLTKRIGLAEHSICQIIFRIPFLLIASIATWKYTNELIPYVLIFGALEAIDIMVYLWSLKRLDATLFELLGMSNILIALFFGAVVGLEIIEDKVITGSIIFMSAILLAMNINIKDLKEIKNSKEFMAMLLRLGQVTVKTYKMFLIKDLIIKGIASNEVIILFSSIVQLSILMIIFRPKINLKETNYWNFTMQGILVMVSTVATGYAMITIGVVTLNVIKTSSTLMLILIYALIDKKLPTIRKSAGVVLGTVGLIITIL